MPLNQHSYADQPVLLYHTSRLPCPYRGQPPHATPPSDTVPTPSHPRPENPSSNPMPISRILLVIGMNQHGGLATLGNTEKEGTRRPANVTITAVLAFVITATAAGTFSARSERPSRHPKAAFPSALPRVSR